MNLNLKPYVENQQPFHILEGLEISAIIMAMNRADDIGIYIHRPVIFTSITGIQNEVFTSAIQKLIKAGYAIQGGGKYWFRHFIAMNCGSGEGLLRNKILSVLLSKFANDAVGHELETEILKAYPEIKNLVAQVKKGKRAKDVVKAMKIEAPATTPKQEIEEPY